MDSWSDPDFLESGIYPYPEMPAPKAIRTHEASSLDLVRRR